MVVHAADLQILHEHFDFTFEKGLGYPRRFNANGMKINSVQLGLMAVLIAGASFGPGKRS
jgi:hypothetical protein